MRLQMTKPDTDLIPSKPHHPDAEKWLIENHSAILAYNEWVTKNGLPLEQYRRFLAAG
jgi:post-segregation antitoxin (ccd killing protein)